MKRVRSENEVVQQRITNRVTELVEGWTTAETQWVMAADGSRLEPVQHIVDHDPLLVQLEQVIEGTTHGVSGPGAKSRPPVSLHVVDTLVMIRAEVSAWMRVGLGHTPAAEWCEAVIDPGSADAEYAADGDKHLVEPVSMVMAGHGPRHRLRLTRSGVLYRPASESATARDLRRLASESWSLAGRNTSDDRREPDDLQLLDQDVLRWWGRARLVTLWDMPAHRPHVPCMQCGKVGAIQVRFNPTAAVCFDCGATWDQASIGILGSHIQLAMEFAERPAASIAADEEWWKRLAPWMHTEPTMTSGGRP